MRVLTVQAHCSDLCNIAFPNSREHEGYVPRGLGIGGGDDIRLDIDIDSGKIVGWNDRIRDEILSRQEFELNCSGEPK
jgi:hypothetical protein